MQLLKRIGLFLLTNLLVVALLSIALFVIEAVFGINITGNTYTQILMYAFLVGFAGSFISLATSRWMAKKMYSITPVSSSDVVHLSQKEQAVYNLVSSLATQYGITMPEVGFYESPEANAFATGMTKNSSLVAVSSGLLEKMDAGAIEGVVAHEMSHVLNGDMVTMTLLQGIMNTFVIFISRVVAMTGSDSENGGSINILLYFFLQFVLGLLASMVVMWFSRYREYRADEGSAEKVGKEKMIAALKSLQTLYPSMHPSEESNMNAFAISAKDGMGFMRLFASHPDLEDRIRNLESR